MAIDTRTLDERATSALIRAARSREAAPAPIGSALPFYGAGGALAGALVALLDSMEAGASEHAAALHLLSEARRGHPLDARPILLAALACDAGARSADCARAGDAGGERYHADAARVLRGWSEHAARGEIYPAALAAARSLDREAR